MGDFMSVKINLSIIAASPNEFSQNLGKPRHLSGSMSTKQPFILAVVTNPEPHNIRTILDCNRPVMNAHPCGPIPAHFLEMQ
jgi:hypothetical protein